MVKLAKNPGIGHWREEPIDKRHRFLLVYSYLIVYRHETKPLQIIRVLHAARDVQSILGLAPDEPSLHFSSTDPTYWWWGRDGKRTPGDHSD